MNTVTCHLAALALLAPISAAQLVATPPFVGEISESLDSLGDPVNVMCIQQGIFNGSATMCTPTTSKLRVTGSWNNQCQMSGVNGLGSFAGSTSGVIEIVMGTPVARFGAYFGTNSTNPNADVRFYDEAGTLIGSEFITYPTGCNWNWYGWETTGPVSIKRIELDGTHPNNGFVLVDNLEANITGNYFKAAPDFLSWQSGGQQSLNLYAGPQFAGLPYLVLGSASGDSPTFPIDGQLLPLLIDNYFIYTLTSPNSPPLTFSTGTLDSQGNAIAYFTLPAGLPASIVGSKFYHAYVVIELTPTLLQVVLASNPVNVTIGL